jgi:hypothetical protein
VERQWCEKVERLGSRKGETVMGESGNGREWR